MAVAGIDLGTTFSAIAYLDGEGRPKILENREGDRTTPSAVNFDENGTPLVGVMAKQLSVEQPGNTVQYVKRSIGDKNWHFLTDSGEQYSAEAISALILKRLKDDAESLLAEAQVFGRKQKAVLDQVAAQAILQGFFDGGAVEYFNGREEGSEE